MQDIVLKLRDFSICPLFVHNFTYCSQIWRPHLLKDILALEQIQCRATKYILNNYSFDYRSRLIHLNILHLMMQLELYNIMFFVRCLKGPTDAFNIYDHVTFCTSSTRSSTHLKLQHTLSRTNSARHFYFNKIPRLRPAKCHARGVNLTLC